MSDFVTADTQFGRVRGTKKISCLGTPINTFLGIPFAKPPVADLRFKDPVPPNKWENVYDATEQKSSSVGENFYLKKIAGSEDCLNLNIFTKDLNPTKLQPVMIYIHGGGYYMGSNTVDVLGPDYLLMADVVLVTINYRLGALGFLSLKDKSLNVPGNAGMKDQVMAFEFVKNNIRHFGGDPSNVTIFGQSAGGSSVSWHCVSERSKGLFQKAIIMAGSVLNQFSFVPERNWACRLAKKLSYTGSESEKDVLDFLMSADPLLIAKVQNSLVLPEENNKIGYAFAPHIEQYETEQAFNLKRPIDLVRHAWSNDIDVLIGGTADEGLLMLEFMKDSPNLLKNMKLEDEVPSEIEVSEDDPIHQQLAEKLRKIYYPLGTDPTEDLMAMCRLKADKALWHGMSRLIRSRQQSGGEGKTYLFRFAVDSETQNHYRNSRIGSGVRGVCHGDEIGYLFKNIYVERPPTDSMEFKAIKRIVSFFTSFASNNDPNSNLISADIDINWKPVESTTPPFKCLSIGENLSFEDFPGSKQLKVWDDLYIETNTPLF